MKWLKAEGIRPFLCVCALRLEPCPLESSNPGILSPKYLGEEPYLDAELRGFAPIGMLEYSIIPCGLPREWPHKAP